MKVRIDKDVCTGHGRCYTVASEVFDADDDGYGVVIAEDVPADLEAKARLGASTCPEGAITLVEEP